MTDANTAVQAELQPNSDTTAHGSAHLPLARYCLSAEEMLPFYPLHWHEETEIISVRQGKCVLRADGERVIAEEGDVIFLRPFAIHSVNRLENCDVRLDAVVLNVRALCRNDTSGALKSFLPVLNEQNSAPCVVRKEDGFYNGVRLSVDALLACGHGRADTQTDLIKNLRALFNCVFVGERQNADGAEKNERRAYTMKLALEYVRNEYTDTVVVQKLAEHVGYSEFYTMKLFKQFTGYSCVDYVNNYRLSVIGQQLRKTSEDVAIVAKKAGYNNVSYFNRQFKKLYGQTPKEFRKQWTSPPK